MGGQEPGGHDRELENTDTLSLTPEQSAGRGREGMPAESRVGDEVPLGAEVQCQTGRTGGRSCRGRLDSVRRESVGKSRSLWCLDRVYAAYLSNETIQKRGGTLFPWWAEGGIWARSFLGADGAASSPSKVSHRPSVTAKMPELRLLLGTKRDTCRICLRNIQLFGATRD